MFFAQKLFTKKLYGYLKSLTWPQMSAADLWSWKKNTIGFVSSGALRLFFDEALALLRAERLAWRVGLTDLPLCVHEYAYREIMLASQLDAGKSRTRARDHWYNMWYYRPYKINTLLWPNICRVSLILGLKRPISHVSHRTIIILCTCNFCTKTFVNWLWHWPSLRSGLA